MTVSIIIPTYNGLSLLTRRLPTLLAADGVSDCELIVVDDGSTDDSVSWLASNAPSAQVVALKENGGFSRACNAGIRLASGAVLVFLNNDVSVDQGFLAPLLRSLHSSPDVFAVNSRILLPGKDMIDEGEKFGRVHNGLFYVDCRSNPAYRPLTASPTLYATACAAAYRRDMVDRLGGFDEIYSPCYWEDVDLSYRALKRGWKVLYEPDSLVYHEHESTTSRMDRKRAAVIRSRNQLLFTWNNMTGVAWTAQSLLLAPMIAIYRRLRDRDQAPLAGWRAAVREWPQISVRRKRERAEATVSDRVILGRLPRNAA